MRLHTVLTATRAELQSALQENDANGCWTDELCAIEFGEWLPSDDQVRWDAYCLMVAEQQLPHDTMPPEIKAIHDRLGSPEYSFS
jgi:hypothetical protein